MARTLRILLMLSLAGFMVSCKSAQPSFYVVKANYKYDQGRYQEAVASYFKALDFGLQTSEIYYNLGTAYNALGEVEPALAMWQKAIDEGNDFLKSYAYYNQGVVYYQLNRYNEAVKVLKLSLEINPSDINTKINLELALNKRQELMQKPPAENKPSQNNQLNDQQNRTLDYLKRREVYFWQSGKEGEAWQNHQNDW